MRIWDIIEVCLNPEDAQPKQVLHDCHADWITDCKWSEVGDFLVSKNKLRFMDTYQLFCLHFNKETT